ncbi:MAG: DUF1330 domain-containing protein [Rhodanobacter sp.]
MSAFLVVTARISDPLAFRAYAEQAAALVAAFGGRYRVLGSVAEALEGHALQGKVVISEWLSMEAARRFWTSPEYTQVKRLREGTGSFDVMLVNGVPDQAA